MSHLSKAKLLIKRAEDAGDEGATIDNLIAAFSELVAAIEEMDQRIK